MKDHVFNNILIILNEDFAQILLMIRKNNRAAIILIYLQRSFL